MDLIFKKCTLDDVNTLCKIARETYSETFSHLNTATNMEVYLREAFSIEKLSSELSQATSIFYALHADGRLAGYLKLNEAPGQTDINDKDSLEVERIYLSKEFQDKGLGRTLMDKAVETAKLLGKSYLWLGVWEINEKAISFYKRCGFYEFGRHFFIMGDEEQSDYIMRKDLNI